MKTNAEWIAIFNGRMERFPIVFRIERFPVVFRMERFPIVFRMERFPIVFRMERFPIVFCFHMGGVSYLQKSCATLLIVLQALQIFIIPQEKN